MHLARLVGSGADRRSARIKYYEQVQARDPASRDYLRTFLMPGVLHCAGGPGPDRADWTTVIDDWVEKGIGARARDRAARTPAGKAVAHAPALRVSAARRLQRQRLNRRREEFHLFEVTVT